MTNPRSVVRPSIVTSPDRHANSELEVGDYFIVRRWVGDKAYVRAIATLAGSSALFSPEPAEGFSENSMLRHDLLRLDGVQYPSAVVTRWSSQEKPHHLQLDLTEFECERASPEYAASVKASAKSEECPCSACRASRRSWYKPWTWGR